MVDNSNSMTEEQAAFVAQLPRLISVLTTGDLNLDETPDFPPIRRLQVGVITSDMGTSGRPIPTCDDGDDGVLLTEAGDTNLGCLNTYPAVQTYDGDADDFAQSVSCVARAGIGGCGWEQQMESVLKAVTPSTSPITFLDGTGHADGANAGLLREDAMLAIIVLTDEDDCSVEDTLIFDSNQTYPGNLNVRCALHPNALYPLRRYVDGLLATKRPELLFFTLIAGVPARLIGTDYTTMLADPEMQSEVDPNDDNRLVASCDDLDLGLAFPPRRMVEVAERLDSDGANVVIGSICEDDLSGPIDRLLASIAQRATCAF